MGNESTKPDTAQESVKPDKKPELQDTGTEGNTELEALKTTNTTYEKTLKSIFGVADDEELGDLTQRMETYNNSMQSKLSAVNDKIIAAELKSLQGYDTKLLAKVIDRSNIRVSEDGTVTGLTEAVETAAKEFPAVVKKQDSKPYAPYNPAGTGNGTHKTMNDIIRNKRSY